MQILSGALLVAGGFFFLAGTVGLLRFPDVYCRLHAITKADNLGLGLVVLGLSLQPAEWSERLQLLLIWLLALVAAATVCHLLARDSLHRRIEPRTGPGCSAADGVGREGA
ncbi:MAG TPA: monovalent cation/H(+) antiporter subunit G [Longimicrobiales bacterium]|nr:monovalent cation/H(+) antiporter subunit G [Longimicrobiales bacterium]